MAEKATPNERIYTIPLRQAWIKTPRDRRVNRSVNVIREFLMKHMKAEDVKISVALNEELWKNSIHRPPSKIKIKAKKEGDAVEAMLPTEISLKKEEKKKGKLGKIKEKVTGKGKEEKEETIKEIKKEAGTAVKEAIKRRNTETKEKQPEPKTEEKKE